MVRKARAGHVTGGVVFGYDNVDVPSALLDAQGRAKRSHVDRQINEREAAVVHRIFTLCTEGKGLRAIARTLNAENALSPRATKGWAPSSVRVVLFRRLYAGELIWGRTTKHNRAGGRAGTRRPESEWIRVPVEHLRIVTEMVWERAHNRLQATRLHYLRRTDGKLWGHPPGGAESKYLLSGLAQCGQCGGAMIVRTWRCGSRRAFFYGCQNYHLRGRRACTNNVLMPMDLANTMVLHTIEANVLRPEIILGAVRKALERLQPSEGERKAQREALEKSIAAVEKELSRYTEAVAVAGPLRLLFPHFRSVKRDVPTYSANS